MEISVFLFLYPSYFETKTNVEGLDFFLCQGFSYLETKIFKGKYILQEKLYSRLHSSSHYFPLRKEETEQPSVGHCIWMCCLLKDV